VIGADSLVRGTIPDHCLALGFPARVVSKPPEFPSPVTYEDKVRYLHEITDEMIECFRGSDLICNQKDSDWTVVQKTKGWFGSRTRRWTIRILSSDGKTLADELTRAPADIVVSLFAIPPEIRNRLNSVRCVWMDIHNKERSDHGSEMGEEVALYLRRYGVRFLRQKPE
jgi:hypothetical protein